MMKVREMNCLKNAHVESYKLIFNQLNLKMGLMLQDTPGVDSNVASHQSITEQYMYTSR